MVQQVARVIGEAAGWVGGVSWQAGILIALVLVVRWIMGRRLSAGWRCALWVLVGVRLVVPGVVDVGEIARVFRVGGGATSVALAPRTGATASNAHSGWTVTVRTFWDGAVVGSGVSEVGKGEHGPQTRAARWGEGLGWAWAAGVAVMVGRLVGSNWRLARRVRGMKRVEDAAVLRVVRECAGEMGVRRKVTVVETGDVRSPAVWGVWRAVVMLPVGGRSGPQAGRLNGEDLRLVLLHEMAHVRRGDVVAEWVVGVLRAVHWFNPLVWMAAAACRADRELACDQAVLRRVGAESRTEYGACLLRVVEAVGGMRPHPAAVGVFGRKGNLRRRIDMIAAYRGRRSAAWSVAGLAAFVAVGCAAATGAKEGKVEEVPKSQAATGVVLADKRVEKAPAPAVAAAANADQERPQSAADQATLAVLDKQLPELRMDAVPFSDVIDFFRDVTGLNVFVNWRALEAAGIERNTPITTRLHNVRARTALATVLRDAGGGIDRVAYEVDDGVVTVTTANDLKKNTVTRVYDIRDLLVEIPDFIGPMWATAGSGALPATRPAAATTRPAGATRQDRVDQIVRLLTATVEPDSWRENGGVVGSVREVSGQLVVTQTPENQKRLAVLLGQLREARAVQIRVEARYVFVDQATLDDMGSDLRDGTARKGGTFVTDEQVADLMKRVQRSKASTVVTSPRVTLFNGQRAWIGVKSSTAYVKDIVVVRTKEGETRYEPRTGTVDVGLELDLQGTASADRSAVTLTLRSVMSALNGMKSRPVAGAAAAAAGVDVQVPDVTSRTTETSVSVPSGRTLMMVAMTPEAAEGAGGRPKGQTFIFVKPTVIVQQ